MAAHHAKTYGDLLLNLDFRNFDSQKDCLVGFMIEKARRSIQPLFEFPVFTC